VFSSYDTIVHHDRIVNITSTKSLQIFPGNFAMDNNYFYSRESKRHVKFYDIETMNYKTTLDPHCFMVFKIISSNNKLYVHCWVKSDIFKIKMFNIKTTSLLREIKIDKGDIMMDVSDNEIFVVNRHANDTIKKVERNKTTKILVNENIETLKVNGTDIYMLTPGAMVKFSQNKTYIPLEFKIDHIFMHNNNLYGIHENKIYHFNFVTKVITYVHDLYHGNVHSIRQIAIKDNVMYTQTTPECDLYKHYIN
jgi:hypothetical protein